MKKYIYLTYYNNNYYYFNCLLLLCFLAGLGQSFFVYKATPYQKDKMHFHFGLSGPYVMVWQKGQDVLTAKSMMVTPDPRIQLVNDNDLQVRSIKPSDAGDYNCKISVLGDPVLITHTLEILSKPIPAFSYIISIMNNPASLFRSVLFYLKNGGEKWKNSSQNLL